MNPAHRTKYGLSHAKIQGRGTLWHCSQFFCHSFCTHAITAHLFFQKTEKKIKEL